MIFIALIIGAILIVAAIRNSQGALATALTTDAPGYVIWAAAIVAVGAIGFVPDLKPISRGLLALIVLVIFLRNYQTIISGFEAVDTSSTGSTSSTSSSNTSSGNTSTAISNFVTASSDLTSQMSNAQSSSGGFGSSGDPVEGF